MHVVGMVLHPARDSAEAVDAVLGWAERKGGQVLRLADRQRAPVLGVNLGKLGFLAEVDVPELATALSAIDEQEFTIEPRLAVDAVLGDQVVTAFNDVALV